MVAPGEGFEFGKIEVLVVFDFDFWACTPRLRMQINKNN